MKPPHPEPGLDAFRGGVGVITRGDVLAGHVATEVSTFWSPCSPFRYQWWVQIVVVWADGSRERCQEDYPPWSYVAEMSVGLFDWQGRGARAGRYGFSWLPADEAREQRELLGIADVDF